MYVATECIHASAFARCERELSLTLMAVSGVVGSGALGLLGSSALAWRWSRTPLLVALTAGFGAVAGMVASDDVRLI